jgi:hypothetical protein
VPINRVSLGSNLYLFESQEPQFGECVIVGHGGRLREDGKMTVPADTEISFYTVDGSAVETNTAAAIALRRDGVRPREISRPGEQPWNYRVQKYNGDGADAVSYREVKARMELNREIAWVPHVVTIRNRKVGARTVHLSDIIREVQRKYPHITVFHYAACREAIGCS